MLPPARTVRRYWLESRAPRYSVLFAVPLLLCYEALVAVLPRAETGGVRNGADVMLESLFSAVAGARGPLLLGVVLVAAGAWIVVRDCRAHGWQLRSDWFGLMLAESVALAVIFGVVVGVITAQLLGAVRLLALAPAAHFDVWTRLMVSLGAGLYEELVFRVLLVSGLAVLARGLLGWGPRAAGVFAAVGGALVFSFFHYVGAYGDAFTVASFTFRAIAGLVLSGIYLVRGFGIVAWTHALYDVMLLFR